MVKVKLEPAHIEGFRAIIMRRLGLRFDDSKLQELADVLSARMSATSTHDADFYLSVLASSSEELRSVVARLTVPETYFFRIPDHFSAFSEIVLPQRLSAQIGARQLRVLSAGCATGEEAYSIAILLRERVDLRTCAVTIRGVDINPEVILKARQAHYSKWALRETPPEAMGRYFRANGREFQLDDSIRGMVQFEEGNLADSSASFWRANAYDAVFLRNVVMYFSPQALKEVVERVADSLAPGGYLFLGPAETLRGVSQRFHLCHTHGTFYYQVRPCGSDAATQLAPRAFVPAPAPPVQEQSAKAETPVAEPGRDWLRTIQQASERIEYLARNPAAPQKATQLSHRAGAGVTRNLPKLKHASPDVSTALDLLQRERFAEALDALQPLPTQSAADPDVQLLRAVLLANSGDLSRAEQACKLLLADDELNAGAHYVMALCREHEGDRHAAEEHDQAAMYLDPSFAMPHLHLGLLAKRASDWDMARQELHQASLLLVREDASRILLFGGGFSRETLTELCRRELQACGGAE